MTACNFLRSYVFMYQNMKMKDKFDWNVEQELDWVFHLSGWRLVQQEIYRDAKSFCTSRYAQIDFARYRCVRTKILYGLNLQRRAYQVILLHSPRKSIHNRSKIVQDYSIGGKKSRNRCVFSWLMFIFIIYDFYQRKCEEKVTLTNDETTSLAFVTVLCSLTRNHLLFTRPSI